MAYVLVKSKGGFNELQAQLHLGVPTLSLSIHHFCLSSFSYSSPPQRHRHGRMTPNLHAVISAKAPWLVWPESCDHPWTNHWGKRHGVFWLTKSGSWEHFWVIRPPQWPGQEWNHMNCVSPEERRALLPSEGEKSAEQTKATQPLSTSDRNALQLMNRTFKYFLY